MILPELDWKRKHTMAEAAMADTKVKRRTTKAALNLQKKLKESRPDMEVMEAFQSMKGAYDDLIVKHEDYTQLI